MKKVVEKLTERVSAGVHEARSLVPYVRGKLAALSEYDEVHIRKDEGTAIEFIQKGRGVILVRYVPKEAIHPRFGSAARVAPSYGDVLVRDDLPEDVKRFVRMHEIFHILDDSERGGELGRELRANFVPGIKDPKGFLAATKATLTDRERVQFYSGKIKQGVTERIKALLSGWKR